MYGSWNILIVLAFVVFVAILVYRRISHSRMTRLESVRKRLCLLVGKKGRDNWPMGTECQAFLEAFRTSSQDNELARALDLMKELLTDAGRIDQSKWDFFALWIPPLETVEDIESCFSKVKKFVDGRRDKTGAPAAA